MEFIITKNIGRLQEYIGRLNIDPITQNDHMKESNMTKIYRYVLGLCKSDYVPEGMSSDKVTDRMIYAYEVDNYIIAMYGTPYEYYIFNTDKILFTQTLLSLPKHTVLGNLVNMYTTVSYFDRCTEPYSEHMENQIDKPTRRHYLSFSDYDINDPMYSCMCETRCVTVNGIDCGGN